MLASYQKIFYVLVISCLFSSTCNKESYQVLIVPAEGYHWPSQERSYWPTDGWKTASMEDHNINLSPANPLQVFAISYACM